MSGLKLGGASKSLTEQTSDHLQFPLLHPELETLNVQMNESFLGEKLSQRFLSSVLVLCWEVRLQPQIVPCKCAACRRVVRKEMVCNPYRIKAKNVPDVIFKLRFIA